MTGSNGTGAADAAPGPRPIAELLTLRTDYEDVPVEALGGEVLRVYALSGTARAILVPDMAAIAGRPDAKDSQTIREVFTFQTRVVAASVGYPQEEWDAFGALGSETIQALYAVAARLSGLDADEQGKVKARLPRQRSAASGTG